MARSHGRKPLLRLYIQTPSHHICFLSSDIITAATPPPSKNLISPKKPVLNESDHGCLRDLFEMRLATDARINCHPTTQAIFEAYRDEQYGDYYIKSHEGAISFLNSENFLDTRKIWLLPGEGRFIDMMRHVLTDYYQSCRKSTPINPSHEKTFFCEIVVPIFKNFGVMVEGSSGSW